MIPCVCNCRTLWQEHPVGHHPIPAPTVAQWIQITVHIQPKLRCTQQLQQQAHLHNHMLRITIPRMDTDLCMWPVCSTPCNTVVCLDLASLANVGSGKTARGKDRATILSGSNYRCVVTTQSGFFER